MRTRTIKKLKVFGVSTLLVGSLVLLPSCSEKYEDNMFIKESSVYVGNDKEELADSERVFDVGEHILIKHVHLDYSEIDSAGDYQIPNIEGYTIIGSNQDKLSCQLIYVNDEVVKAKATAIDGETGEYIYQNFGEVVNYKEENNNTLYKK